MKPYVFGVDIGGTTVKMGLFRTDGTLLDTWEIPTRTENNGEAILPDIAEAAEEKLQEMHIGKESVEGLGLGVPGPVADDGTVFRCVNLGWDIINVREVLEGMTGLKVKVGNDANVAALGEMWQGGAKGHRNVVMMTLGTGVGGGIIIDGKIIAGVNGAAGEIGHLPMEEQEELCCGCGKKGCLEQYGSANGIVLLAKRYLEKNPQESVLNGMSELNSKEILDAAKNGDAAALAITEEAGHYLGKAAAMIACVVNPEVFVLGGGMSKAGTFLYDIVKKHYTEYAFHASRQTPFCGAELGNSAGVYGAACMVLENV